MGPGTQFFNAVDAGTGAMGDGDARRLAWDLIIDLSKDTAPLMDHNLCLSSILHRGCLTILRRRLKNRPVPVKLAGLCQASTGSDGQAASLAFTTAVRLSL